MDLIDHQEEIFQDLDQEDLKAEMQFVDLDQEAVQLDLIVALEDQCQELQMEWHQEEEWDIGDLVSEEEEDSGEEEVSELELMEEECLQEVPT